MSESFRKAIGKKNPFQLREQEVYLHLWRTMDLLNQVHDEFFRQFKLTPQQYNILRILRGHHPCPLTVSQIRENLIATTPDTTRLIDRLENRGFVTRDRPKFDKRVVQVSLTKKARTLLGRMDKPLLACHRAQLGHVDDKILSQLDTLLDTVREPLEGRKENQ